MKEKTFRPFFRFLSSIQRINCGEGLDSFFLFKHNAREPLNKVLTYAHILVSEFTYIVALLKSAVAIAGCAMTS